MKKYRVLLTRTESTPHNLHLKYPRFEWIDFPLIEFAYQSIQPSLLNHINDEMDWIVFTSQNGVKAFFEQSELKKSIKIACVGPKTREVIEKYGYSVAFQSSISTSFSLAQEIPLTKSENVCYIGGNLSNERSVQLLKDKGKTLLQIEVYRTQAMQQKMVDWKEILINKIDVISFCSPSAVHSFFDQLSKLKLKPNQDVLYAALGNTTASTIESIIGINPLVGDSFTFDSMIEKIVETIAHDS